MTGTRHEIDAASWPGLSDACPCADNGNYERTIRSASFEM